MLAAHETWKGFETRDLRVLLQGLGLRLQQVTMPRDQCLTFAPSLYLLWCFLAWLWEGQTSVAQTAGALGYVLPW